MDLAHPLIFWRRWRVPKAEMYSPSPVRAISRVSSLPAAWVPSGQAARTNSLQSLFDAAIIFAAVGALVPAALTATRKGAGSYVPDPHEYIPSFPYNLLWGERSLCSVANLTRLGRPTVHADRRAGAPAAHRGNFRAARCDRALEHLRHGQTDWRCRLAALAGLMTGL